MIIKDNLGDTNKLYLTLHEVDSPLSENRKAGQKAGRFYRIRTKEPKRTKRKYLTSWVHMVNLVWGEKEQSKYKGRQWLGNWGWTDWTCCFWSSGNFTGTPQSYLSSDLLTWHPGSCCSILGLEFYFNRKKIIFPFLQFQLSNLKGKAGKSMYNKQPQKMILIAKQS